MESTPQQKIESGFGASSTAEDVIKGIDLSDKLIIITGGYAGIGLESTRVLIAAGAKVIVPARDAEKAKYNLASIFKDIEEKKVKGSLELESMDLADHQSVDGFIGRF